MVALQGAIYELNLARGNRLAASESNTSASKHQLTSGVRVHAQDPLYFLTCLYWGICQAGERGDGAADGG